jgi:hypothetical protein
VLAIKPTKLLVFGREQAQAAARLFVAEGALHAQPLKPS